MYYYLHGTVTMHLKDSIVVECNGVGYRVLVSRPDDFDLGALQRIYVNLCTTQEDQYLVGFSSFAERAIYERLITVKGVGPKSAMSILSGASVERLRQAIDDSDVAFLRRLPNIGPKTASQIVLDLRGKLTLPLNSPSGERELDDAMIGLKNMGFSAQEIDWVIGQIPERGLKTEDYLRRALALLGNRR